MPTPAVSKSDLLLYLKHPTQPVDFCTLQILLHPLAGCKLTKALPDAGLLYCL